MRKLLIVTILALIPVFCFADTGFIGLGEVVAQEAITVSTTAIGPTAATIAPTSSAGVKYAICTVLSNQIRVRYDGTSPTSTTGHLVYADQYFIVSTYSSVSKVKMIKDTAAAGDATVTCTYER